MHVERGIGNGVGAVCARIMLILMRGHLDNKGL